MDNYFDKHPLAELAILLAIIFVVAAIVITGERIRDNKVWNDGRCLCGGRWEFVQAVGHQSDTDYIYKCNNCGKLIQIENYR